MPTFSGVNTGNPIADYTVNTVVGTYNFIASTVNTVPNALGAVNKAIDNTCQQALEMDSTQLTHELYATGLLSQAGFALDAFNTWATLTKAANTSKAAQTVITASQVAANVGAELVGIEGAKILV